ncbi:hypothetical protein B9Z55_024662 [Caenorhabditis nigoni]|uniref:Homeobox domain-containing protein n=1 Tax=Caenorhabditis nigoni TaxID=1611254 RepID=A0A2G5SVG3_9PELO|nr:hypothetical protein B9Z55_024662 [Caenorhabditis nigoni]
MVNTKKRTLSSQDDCSASRGRPRKCPAPIEEASQRPNPKRSKPIALSESESEPEYDVQEIRPKRGSEKRVIYDDSDSDFEETPPKTKPEKMRKTEKAPQSKSKHAASRNDVSSSSSSPELEADTSEMNVNDEMDDGQPRKPIPSANSKQKRGGKSTDENKKTQINFTKEQHELLLAMFRENENPTKEEQEKLAVDAELTRAQKYAESISKEKGLKLKQVFAISRNPDSATIISLASELHMTTDHVRQHFANMRHRYPQPLQSEEKAKQILMELFQKNPNFCDFSNPELMKKTGWSFPKIRSFFYARRLENGIAAADSQLSYKEAEPIFMDVLKKNPYFDDYRNIELREKTGWSFQRIRSFFNARRFENVIAAANIPLAEKEPEQILMDVFMENPLFDDYGNIELREKTRWRISKRWFSVQRNLNGIQVISRFDESMESIFRKKQFFGTKSKDLEIMTGGSWEMIENWLENKRKSILQSYFKKEISDLPSEMAKYEGLYKKYNILQTTDPHVITSIQRRENAVDLAQYVAERNCALNMLQTEMEGIEQDGGNVLDQIAEENHIDPEFEYPMDENRSVQAVPSQKAVEPEIGNDQTEIVNPHDAPMNKYLDGQLEEVADHQVDFDQNKTPEKDLGFQLNEDQTDFNEVREQLNGENMPPSANMEITEKQEFIEDEENDQELIIFDVIEEDPPQDTAADGYVSIVRVQAAWDDLHPYMEDLVGLVEIGFARKTDMEAYKIWLGGDRMKNLILPFNCSMNTGAWSKTQVMEFFCQILPPDTTTKLVEKVSAGCYLCMFQVDQVRYFNKLNRDEPIINWDQFLLICEELDKIKSFHS